MKSILLVEDTSHLAEEIADILRMEGYEATVAANAVNALELLLQSGPDLIITDLLMPGMDGFEFIEHVRSMAPFKSTPIIILSAMTAPEDRTHGATVGADLFIQKPCKTHELVMSINSLLKE